MSYEQESPGSAGVYVESDPLLGSVLNQRYRIDSILGRGGMGVVYKARALVSDQEVAIKALHLNRLSDPEIVRLFHAEAQAVSRLRHPNTAYLIELGVAETGQPYLVMQLINGKSLRYRLRDQGVLNLAEALSIFPQVMQGLSYAHSSGIVHRDLKPENILIASEAEGLEHAYVVDFGIAALRPLREWESGIDHLLPVDLIGSPAYMSPEQCACLPTVTVASDIYSLAVVMYESLAGRLPYNARTATQIMDAHIMQAPLPLKSAQDKTCNFEAVTAVLAKAMSKIPEHRFLTVADFQEEFCQAAKRDATRVPSLKQRYASGSVLAEEACSRRRNMGNMEELNLSGRWWQKFSRIIEAKRRTSTSKLPEEQFCLAACPHCQEVLEPQVSFCLNCSRSRVSPQDFAKIRTGIGTYRLPLVLSTFAQEKNNIKTRQLFLRAEFFLRNLKFLIALSILLLVSLLWLILSRHQSSGL